MTAGTINKKAVVPANTKAPEPPYVPNFVKTSMPSVVPGLPGMDLYIISDERDIEHIDAETSSNVYYVLGKLTEKKTTKKGTTTTTTTTSTPQLYKRVMSTSGCGILAIENASQMHVGSVDEEIYFLLPKLPIEFVEKIEAFFRAVHKKHQSEAIVVLGYDNDFLNSGNPGDGWVVFVPEQTNTGVHCNYDKEKVMEDKADFPSISLVGTIHSHPEMSAFASATDIEDQKDNDGLHITCGWTGGATEWHVEYQLANRRFTYSIGQIFEMAPPNSYDVEDWVSRVKKQAPLPPSTYKNTGGKNSTSITKPTGHTKAITETRTHGQYYREKFNKNRTQGCPDLVTSTVIAVMDDDASHCVVCQSSINPDSIRNRRCIECFAYLLLTSDDGDIGAIARAREIAYGAAYLPGLEFLSDREAKCNQTVLLWDRNGDKIIKVIYSITKGLDSKVIEEHLPKA